MVIFFVSSQFQSSAISPLLPHSQRTYPTQDNQIAFFLNGRKKRKEEKGGKKYGK